MIEYLEGAAAAVVMVFVHRRAIRHQAARLEARAVTMDKQQKALRRNSERAARKAEDAAARIEQLYMESLEVNRRTRHTLDDPRLKRMLGRQDG